MRSVRSAARRLLRPRRPPMGGVSSRSPPPTGRFEKAVGALTGPAVAPRRLSSRRPQTRLEPTLRGSARCMGHVHVVLRPVASPLALGFYGVAGSSLTLSGLELGWIPHSEQVEVGLIVASSPPSRSSSARSSRSSCAIPWPRRPWACSPPRGASMGWCWPSRRRPARPSARCCCRRRARSAGQRGAGGERQARAGRGGGGDRLAVRADREFISSTGAPASGQRAASPASWSRPSLSTRQLRSLWRRRSIVLSCPRDAAARGQLR